VRVAFRNARGRTTDGGEEREIEEPAHTAADDGPAQMAQALVEENANKPGGSTGDER
jgi:hypothetical protein